MFSHIIVRSMKEGHQDVLDLGALVEAMLFYGRVSLLADGASFPQLLRAWGPDGIQELVQQEFLDLVMIKEMSGVRTDHAGTGRERYAPVTFTVAERTGAE